MSGRIFIDTNVLVYSCSTDDLVKKTQALITLQIPDVWLSAQVLIEFANIYYRKLKVNWPSGEVAVAELSQDFNVHSTTPATIAHATRLAQRYRFSWFDALIVAAALECGCHTLYSEDLSAGQLAANTLRGVNPFAG